MCHRNRPSPGVPVLPCVEYMCAISVERARARPIRIPAARARLPACRWEGAVGAAKRFWARAPAPRARLWSRAPAARARFWDRALAARARFWALAPAARARRLARSPLPPVASADRRGNCHQGAGSQGDLCAVAPSRLPMRRAPTPCRGRLPPVGAAPTIRARAASEPRQSRGRLPYPFTRRASLVRGANLLGRASAHRARVPHHRGRAPASRGALPPTQGGAKSNREGGYR